MSEKYKYPTPMRTIKEYATVDSEGYKEFETIAKNYQSMKNYFFSKYSGISGLKKGFNFYNCRNECTKENQKVGYKLSSSYWQECLKETLGNLKTYWGQIFKEVRKTITNNNQLTEQEKRFLKNLLTSKEAIGQICFNEFDLKKFIKSNKRLWKKYKEEFGNDIIGGIGEKRIGYLFKYIKRVVRKHRSSAKTPYTHNSNYFIASSMTYSQKSEKLKITGVSKNQRVETELKNKRVKLKGQLQVNIKEGFEKVVITRAVKVNKKKDKGKGIRGVDKGYTDLLTSDTGKAYGKGYSQKVRPYVEKQSNKQAQRNYYWSLVRKYEEYGDFDKAERIRKNNLGFVKFNRAKNKFQGLKKTGINRAINDFFKAERPNKLYSEDLTWESKKKNRSKKIQNELSQWDKGYLRERLYFKSYINNCLHEEVNAAYTSQVCHKCGYFGNRDKKHFECLNEKCKWQGDADYNAAINIKNRIKIKEITVYTSYNKVKQILLNKIKN